MKAKLIHEQQGEKTFVLMFATDDEIMAGLTSFAREKHLGASRFTAIGAFQEATLGYFDSEKKDYVKIPIHEQVEVVSVVGDIRQDEKGDPQVHAHVVLGLSGASTRGGPLIEARVRPTLEVVLVESPEHLRRKSDPQGHPSPIRP